MNVHQMIADHPWMERHLRAFPVTPENYRKARSENPSWRYLSKYGRLVAFIFGNVRYFPGTRHPLVVTTNRQGGGG